MCFLFPSRKSTATFCRISRSHSRSRPAPCTMRCTTAHVLKTSSRTGAHFHGSPYCTHLHHKWFQALVFLRNAVQRHPINALDLAILSLRVVLHGANHNASLFRPHVVHSVALLQRHLRPYSTRAQGPCANEAAKDLIMCAVPNPPERDLLLVNLHTAVTHRRATPRHAVAER